MKSIFLLIVWVLSCGVSGAQTTSFSQKSFSRAELLPIYDGRNSSSHAQLLATYDEQNYFRYRANPTIEPPSMKGTSKTNLHFDALEDLGEDFIVIEPFEPPTHLAKKAIIQRGNPFFDAPPKNNLVPPVDPHDHPFLRKQ